ncbi:MAG: hypothetical protein KDB03_16500 [Planctomycetales bacterium]|nr:hypothetical protein [Planctomycetales bacterium]
MASDTLVELWIHGSLNPTWLRQASGQNSELHRHFWLLAPRDLALPFEKLRAMWAEIGEVITVAGPSETRVRYRLKVGA